MPVPESTLQRISGHNSQLAGPLLAGPMLGEVGETTARIWAQARDTGPLTVRVFARGGSEALREVEVTPALAESLCVVAVVDGLEPATAYDYALASALGETPRFPLSTAPPASARRLRLAFGSCYKHYQTESLPIFGAILDDAPDCFLLLGDTCYFLEEADWKDEAAMLRAHLRHRNHPSLRPLLAAVPTLAIWDDHDFGPNDSDSTFANKAASLRTWKRMWAQARFGLPELPGVFSTVRIGPVEIFLLDGRYHRREKRHILGESQLNWLRERLSASTAAVKILASGSQILPEIFGQPPFGWECWRRDAPDELQALLAFLDRGEVTGVLVLSGDPHLGYILHRPGPLLGDGRQAADLWEVTSSPLANKPWHAQVMPADVAQSPRFDSSIRTELATPNYGLLDVDLDREGAELVLGLYDATGAELASQQVALASLAPREHASRLCAAIVSEHRAYLFRGSEYVRCDPSRGTIDAGYPRPIADGWKGAWPSGRGGFDAVLCQRDHDRLYFFKGNGYTRYDLKHDRADAGFPRYIGRHWRGLWPGELGAAFVDPDGKACFIRGRECVRYDLAADRPEPGYPRPLAEEFPGVFADAATAGVDAAIAWPDGALYFVRNGRCVRFDAATQKASEPYPLREGWLGFLPPG
ncbi:MAG: hemopexin repeat-containing protein [Polyangia bacterium]